MKRVTPCAFILSHFSLCTRLMAADTSFFSLFLPRTGVLLLDLLVLLSYFTVVRLPILSPSIFSISFDPIGLKAPVSPPSKCGYPLRPFCPIGNESSIVEPLAKEVRYALEEAARIDDQDAITGLIRSIYFSRIRKVFAPSATCRPKLVFYSCDRSLMSRARGEFCGCAGLGDRLRGVVSVFYMALLTDTVFGIDWSHPQPLENHFEINSELYGVDPANVTSRLSSNYNNWIYWNWVQDEFSQTQRLVEKNGFVDTLKNPNVDAIAISSNSLIAIEGMMLCYRDSVADAYHLHVLNYRQLVSAGLRILFGKPQPQLKWLVDYTWQVTVGHDPASKGQTIGLQLRFNRPKWSESGRVLYNQTDCFLQEIKRLITAHNMTKPAVFITGDTMGEIAKFASKLKKEGIKAYHSHGSYHFDLVDRLKTSDDQRWRILASLYRDWLMLTRMDYLVISRSSFGETAAIYSRRPTRRFVHQVTDSCTFDDSNQLTSLHME